MVPQKQLNSAGHSVTQSIPELEQSKTAVLNTLASIHSRRSYEYAIDRFIAAIGYEHGFVEHRSREVRQRSLGTPAIAGRHGEKTESERLPWHG
jgi:hypothetical protein